MSKTHKVEAYRFIDDHKISLPDFLKKHSTSIENGLSEAEALKKNQLIGDNKLAEKIATPWYILLGKEFVQPFAILLWVAGILTFMLYGIDTEANGAI